MQRRKFGKHNFDVSLLGFGCMRFETVDDPDPTSDVGNINEAKAIKLLRHAIDSGVDYVDTAYNYHGGKSEVLVGKALTEGYREKVKIATKLPVWLLKDPSDSDRILAEQLKKLQTDYVDMYLLHSLNKGTWQSKVLKHDLFSFLDQAKLDGRIKYAGFSFHDDISLFKEIVDAYDWDFCQIQLNYMDEYYQAGVEGLKYAADKGLAVIIMEPLRGGRLVRNIPTEVQEIWDQAPIKRTPAEWSFRWVANFPEVSTILSGMGNFDELNENINTMADAHQNSLTNEELALVNRVQKIYLERTKVKCTDCRYCLPCPQGVSIPRIFDIYNHTSIYNTVADGRRQYARLVTANEDASQCNGCGTCEAICPQNLTIIQYLEDARAALI